MNTAFDKMVFEMPRLLLKLRQTEPVGRDNLRGVPQHGVYVLYEDGNPIYVGRSNRLKARLLEHSRQGSTHYGATLAFNLAKENAAKEGIDISRNRSQLEKDRIFKDMFTQAKNRVYQMKIRTIQVDDPVVQTLFEVYAALALKTKYNDFDTH